MEVEQNEAVEAEVKLEKNVKWFDLALDRNLLDPNFDGYKLSLDPFTHYTLDLKVDSKLDTYNFVESGEGKQKFYFYQHLKLFSFQNLLM